MQKKKARQRRGFIKQLQSRQSVLPGLLLYRLLKCDKIKNKNNQDLRGVKSMAKGSTGVETNVTTIGEAADEIYKAICK